ncbi:MAG: envelope stress response membrane protein PspC, partial [Planctomycetes bacterium]|nr:envelope stress response membrane protein PspC [Planctomycetota bacterium]
MRRKFENTLQGKFYRSRNGVILGVCRGIAEYFNFSLFWIRAIAVIFLIFTGFWPTLIVYFIAALLMKPEPVIPIHTDEDQEFYDSYVHSRKWATDRIKRRYENLERRLRRLEHTVTSPEFDWEK